MAAKIPERRLHYLCDMDGHIALNIGERTLPDRPVREWHFLKAQTIKTADYPDLPGNQLSMTVGDGRGWYGSLRPPGYFQRIMLDMNGAEQVNIEEEIPRPRNGKEYGWVWRGDTWPKEWVKEPFPKCRECYHYHDPAFPVCAKCERCHSPKGKCPTSY